MTETCDVLRRRGGWWEDTFSTTCKFPIGPINTFSNIAYAIGGLFVALVIGTLPAIVFGILMGVLAIGSGLYHGFKTVPMSRLDHVGMYAVFGSLTIYSISPTHAFIGPLMALGATIFAIALAYHSSWKYLLTPVMGITVFITTISVALNNSWKPATLSFGLFLLAYLIWNMDKNRTFFLKRWGHGIWHIITAVAITLLFLNIR